MFPGVLLHYTCLPAKGQPTALEKSPLILSEFPRSTSLLLIFQHTRPSVSAMLWVLYSGPRAPYLAAGPRQGGFSWNPTCFAINVKRPPAAPGWEATENSRRWPPCRTCCLRHQRDVRRDHPVAGGHLWHRRHRHRGGEPGPLLWGVTHLLTQRILNPVGFRILCLFSRLRQNRSL